MSTVRNIFIFAVRDNLLQDLRQEISNTLSSTDYDILEVVANDAIHGISRIELLNFRESAVLIPFWTFEIELTYNNNYNNSNYSIETFDVKHLEMDGVIIDDTHRLINLSNGNHNARIYIRCPIFLYDYSVSIRIRCKLKTSDSDTSNIWSAWTDKKIINIPSTFINKQFDINEMISFVPTHSNHSIPGKIIKFIDKEKDLYQIQTGFITHKLLNNIHSSRIYRNGPYLKNIVVDINKNKQLKITKQLLYGTNCTHYKDEYDDIFTVLHSIFKCYAENYCQKFKSIQISEYVFIGIYFSKYIMDFIININKLKENNINIINRKIKCIMNINHGIMKLVPIWHNCLINHINLVNYHKNNDLIILNPSEMNMKFSCDLCGIEMSLYQWMYKCNGDNCVLDTHFICLICGYNIINQHSKIEKVLIKCLYEYLYMDCIKLIATFVCGSVVSDC